MQPLPVADFGHPVTREQQDLLQPVDLKSTQTGKPIAENQDEKLDLTS
jgi:hypothetical protein